MSALGVVKDLEEGGRTAMEYKIKAHKTFYKDVMFRSRLEARWAAFFDLAGWQWEYEPIDLVGWSPDFKIDIPCRESCGGKHTALIEIKPYYDMNEFYHHPVAYYKYGNGRDDFPLDSLPVDTVAGFGANPDIAFLDITHEDSGGMYTPSELIPNASSKWKEAGNIVQYQYKKRESNVN